ncbi:hypothetical protein B0H16DRAFT_1748258 [Mycena metata]|uniref:Uncharacterized protein n=1 Tax=Mycena metata TaxID=1033252 RepID=A0AAD7DZI6_9AGAR|nr:hypothetical protein B0H16DRAFT_1748258 [Mycena metata]
MPRLKNYGVIFGILYEDESDYPACQALFFPDAYRAHSLAAHESEPKTEYFLVTNPHEARVYTNIADARSSPLLESLWSGHRGLAAVAHALGDWCRSKHGHETPQRTSPRTKKRSAADVASLTTYRHLRPFPPAPKQPKPFGPFTTRTRSSHTTVASASASSVSRAAVKRSPPPPAYAAPNAGLGALGGVVVSAEGHFFRDDAEVTTALHESTVEIKMFRDVASAREWFMGLPPKEDDDDDEK